MALKLINYKNKGAKDLARDGYRKIRIIFINSFWAPLCMKWYRVRNSSVADPDKSIEINIDDITGFKWGFKYTGLSFRGHIKSGNWDQKCESVELLREKEKFKGIWERYREGKRWADTSLFDEYRCMLEDNRHVMGKGNIHDVEEYYKENIDTLYDDIVKNGFLPASEENPHVSPVYVHIDRNGNFIYTGEGNHRLAIAFVLNLKKIPVRVWKRHALWQEKRETILNTQFSELPGNLKKFAHHPDIISERVKQEESALSESTTAEEHVFH